MTTGGPRMAANKPGSSFCPEVSASESAIISPFFFFASRPAITMVTISAQTAGMMFFIMRLVRSTPNASDAAIVFGLGEMMLPALPPPIMASSTPGFERLVFLPMLSAMGATVMTEISIKTPTAQMIMVAMEIAATARFSPSFVTMVSAIFSAEPVLIRAPARMPLVRMRSTDDIMEPAPLTIVETVPSSPPPPIRPPTSAPRMRLYAGCTCRMMRTMAMTRPISAPSVVKVISIGSFSFYFCSFSTRKTCSTVSAIFLYAFALSMASWRETTERRIGKKASMPL